MQMYPKTWAEWVLVILAIWMTLAILQILGVLPADWQLIEKSVFPPPGTVAFPD